MAYLLNKSDRNKVQDTINRSRRNAIGESNNFHRSSATGNGDGSTAIIGLITAGNSTDGYSVTLYGNGVDEAATGTAINVPAVDMAMADSACIGEYAPFFESMITITAWSEES